MIIKRGVTRCYDCYTREKAKTFQVCTLRTSPEKPIHCLVWAKHLFELMFGPPTDQNLLSDILDKLNKDLLEQSPDLRVDLYDRTHMVFQKVYIQMLNELKQINPEKFSHLRIFEKETLNDQVKLEKIPQAINLSVDREKIHSVEFYLHEFYGKIHQN